jgi:hypothetical protein
LGRHAVPLGAVSQTAAMRLGSRLVTKVWRPGSAAVHRAGRNLGVG